MAGKAKLFRALGDDARLKILQRLSKGECCACFFTSVTGKDQTTASRHLKVLTEAGVLKCRRDGRHMIYSIKSKDMKRFLNKCCIGK